MQTGKGETEANSSFGWPRTLVTNHCRALQFKLTFCYKLVTVVLWSEARVNITLRVTNLIIRFVTCEVRRQTWAWVIHTQYVFSLGSRNCLVKILTWLRGLAKFRVKIANFSRLHCLAIPRKELSTKKTKPNIEKWPENLGGSRSHVRILIYRTWAIHLPYNWSESMLSWLESLRLTDIRPKLTQSDFFFFDSCFLQTCIKNETSFFNNSKVSGSKVNRIVLLTPQLVRSSE